MKLFLIVVSLSLVYYGYGRSQHFAADDNTLPAIKAGKVHFGDLKDFKDVELPPKTYQPGFNLTNDGSGNYYFSVFTGLDERYEVGELKNPGTDNEIQSVKGQYVDRYRDEIGVQIIRTIGYVADENGFRPFVVSTDIIQSAIGAPGSAYAGGPDGKSGISSATLGSLVGGNLG
ncbi:unnamed protein product [Tenebrio molitor]|nr:unnamed protein product [Tenebrio molitor]